MKTYLLIFTGLFIAGICHAQGEFSFKEHYDVSTPAKLILSSSDGNISVSPGNGNSIDVTYIVKKRNKVLNISRKELEKEVTVNVTNTSNSLDISIKYPLNYNNFKDRYQVSFIVTVPKETACELQSSDGNIAISGLTGDQSFKTSDGNLDISDITGKVNGKTSDGNIDTNDVNGAVEVRTSDGNITMKNIKGDVKAATSDGNIGLNKITGDVSVSTSDGEISFNGLSGSFSASTSDGNVHGTIIALQKALSVKTSDGSIDITIPDRLGLDLDVRGESLHVPLSNFSGTSEEKYIHGTVNGGGIAVNLSADGNITLAYR
ncbi:MAG TPA: DUF4097 family beta strand repeat-containing protein [Ohtaekwangia sp.]|uniref:DUF4097 family beta strand repeat-containing protein n=1 Tax=Ohtaekwangia sp. TaxID=2066019 RepID=UPI002F9220EA